LNLGVVGTGEKEKSETGEKKNIRSVEKGRRDLRAPRVRVDKSDNLEVRGRLSRRVSGYSKESVAYEGH